MSGSSAIDRTSFVVPPIVGRRRDWRRPGAPRLHSDVPAERIAENLAFINWTVLTGARDRLVRGGRPGPAADRRDARLPRLHRRVRRRVRGARVPVRPGPARDAAATRRSWSNPRSTSRGGSRSSCSFCVSPRSTPWPSPAAAGAAARRAGRRGRGRRAGVRRARLGRRAAGSRCRSCSSSRSLAVATGGVFAAMILGHWYLVTPKLPEAPLILISPAAARGRGAPGRAVRGLGRDRRRARRRRPVRRPRRASGRCSSGSA